MSAGKDGKREREMGREDERSQVDGGSRNWEGNERYR